jgi:hypothetical protein
MRLAGGREIAGLAGLFDEKRIEGLFRSQRALSRAGINSAASCKSTTACKGSNRDDLP